MRVDNYSTKFFKDSARLYKRCNHYYTFLKISPTFVKNTISYEEIVIYKQVFYLRTNGKWLR